MRYLSFILFILLVFGFLAAPQANALPAGPPLDQCVDFSLEKDLQRCLLTLGLDRAAREKSLGVALVDLTDTTSPRLATVNGDLMMYAASLPKIAILLGAYEQVAEGRLTFSEKIKKKLTRMIRNSSNRAATEMLQLVGEPYLADLLQSERYKLYNTNKNGGLWVGRGYSKAPVWKRDPLHQISHGATPFEVARFYYLLETGRLVSPDFSIQMKDILGEPAIHHKFVKGLEKARRPSLIYRKSGTWREYHADSAIVERGDHRYIAVALARSPKGETWLQKLIVALDDLIYRPETNRILASQHDGRIQ